MHGTNGPVIFIFINFFLLYQDDTEITIVFFTTLLVRQIDRPRFPKSVNGTNMISSKFDYKSYRKYVSKFSVRNLRTSDMVFSKTEIFSSVFTKICVHT